MSHNLTLNNFRNPDAFLYLDDHPLMPELYYNDNKYSQKIDNETEQFVHENLDFLKDLDDCNETIKLKEKLIKCEKDNNNYTNDKKYIQSIQLKARAKIYLKRPFKEKKILGRKKKPHEGLGEHNKFSDDNILRKCKNVISDSVLKFINLKIKILYSNENEILLKEKGLFKMKQNQTIKSRANYNKEFLNKTLKEIFSENISTKYTRYSHSHNKDLIEFLINEKDETKKRIFNKIFNLTFLDCLKQFGGSVLCDELQGMNQLDKYIKENKNVKGDEEYCSAFSYFKNISKILSCKKSQEIERVKTIIKRVF